MSQKGGGINIYLMQGICQKPFHKMSFFIWESLHARLNSYYKARSYKKKTHKKIEAYKNLFRKNLQLIGVY